MARRTYDDGLGEMKKPNIDMEEVTRQSRSWEEENLRNIIELSEQVSQIRGQTKTQTEEFVRELQELKKETKAVKAMDFRITPVLDEATKKEVQRQVQDAVADSLKDIQEAVNSLKKAKEMEKGVWISEGQLWYWGILFFVLSSLFMAAIGAKIAPWLNEQPLVIVLLVIGAICSNFLWYGIKWVRRRFFSS